MRRQVEHFFKDNKGRVVIVQWPNTPLWVAIAFYILTRISIPLLNQIGSWGLIISLLYWSYLEIVYGVNSWRRFLGLAIAISQLVKLFAIINL